MEKLETLNKAMGKLGGAEWSDEENRKLGPWWRNGTLIWGLFDDANYVQIRDPTDDEIGRPDDLIRKLGALDHWFFSNSLYGSIALFQTYGPQVLIEKF